MNLSIEIRKTDDGAVFARRIDGKPLTPEDREQAKRLAFHEPESPVIDQIIDDRTIAVLIDSELLGAPIWFAFRDAWRPDEADSIPIFYAGELPALRSKTAEQLRSIFNVKRTFGGGMVKQ